jgi:benzoyl-CoA-dihydrodiol lyase
MAETNASPPEPVHFETHPERYVHWRLDFPAEHGGAVARLVMDVKEDRGLRPGYPLKLNSYDLGVDLELADALQRIRFEHPEVRAVLVTSGKDRIFCSGANIYMLGSSTHGFKVNFCKFTNETRLYLEEMSNESGIPSLCAVNGTASGGGYELAIACDEIVLADDGSSAGSFPEAPPKAKFDEAVKRRVADLASRARRKQDRAVVLGPLEAKRTDKGVEYRYVSLEVDGKTRVARLTVRAPVAGAAEPQTPEELAKRGASAWAIQAFRELDDALLELRFNRPTVGVVALRTEGDPKGVLAVDAMLAKHREDGLVRETILHVKRVLKRLDLTAKSFFALGEPGSCFVGTLLELALAADRFYMKDADDEEVAVATSPANAGLYPMANGLTRLGTRFLKEPERVSRVLEELATPRRTPDAVKAGLVTFAPDDIDWDDEIRIAFEERAAMSPDAMTGMEASLRFAGPETMETKIFGRLSAWQNWIFQRPNAVGEKGALTLYGKPERPEFNWQRT